MEYTLEKLDLSKLGLKGMLYLPFTEDRVTGVWREDGRVVGLIQGKGIEDSNATDIYIDFFEVLPKGQGYGFICISELFKMYEQLKVINGASDEHAVLFWESVGAFFPTACDTCDEIEDCISNGYQCENRISTDFLLCREDVLIA